MERALAGRLRRPPRWDCDGDAITIGASLSTDAWRQVLKGGAPSTDEGRSFRAFWGDKCQARRFKDGRVLEASVLNVTAVTHDGIFITPPFSNILRGVTLRRAMELARSRLVGDTAEALLRAWAQSMAHEPNKAAPDDQTLVRRRDSNLRPTPS